MPFTKLIVSAALGALIPVAACSNTNSASNSDQTARQAAGELLTDSGVSKNPVADSLIAVADSARIQGSPDAPLWIIEISDFQCPYCGAFHRETYPLLRKEYVETGKARLAYINFPLPMHQNAVPAALAAMCAAAQGKFWQMHDALFDTQDRWGSGDPSAVIDSLASSVGVNMEPFHACLKNDVMRPLVDADKARAEDRGVNATPTFLIGSQKIEGAQPIDAFRRVIDAQLARSTSGDR